jgi:hypothetical protein
LDGPFVGSRARHVDNREFGIDLASGPRDLPSISSAGQIYVGYERPVLVFRPRKSEMASSSDDARAGS